MLRKILVVMLGIIFLGGCTTVQKGAAVGAAGGAALGGIIGHQSGHGAEGAGIGAAVGAIGGAIVGEQMEKKFCPRCGRRFPSSVNYCPYDGEKLKPVEK